MLNAPAGGPSRQPRVGDARGLLGNCQRTRPCVGRLLSFSARTRRIRVASRQRHRDAVHRGIDRLCAKETSTINARTTTAATTAHKHTPHPRGSPLFPPTPARWPRADDRRSTDSFGAETQWQPPSAPTSCRRPRTTPAQATRRSGRRSTRSSPSGSSEATSRSSRRRATTRPTQS